MIEHRPADLQNVLALTQRAITARVDRASPAARAMQRVAVALDQPAARQPRPTPHALPACAHLDAALNAAERGPADLVQLARAVRALSPQIAWRRRTGGDAAFQNGHANADLVGTSELALERRDDAWIGLSLMAPGVTYPDHHHAPEEVYLVLSGGDWRQSTQAGADPWHTPGLGGIVYNPHDIVHAMRSGPEPLLAIWCLPLGNPAQA